MMPFKNITEYFTGLKKKKWCLKEFGGSFFINGKKIVMSKMKCIQDTTSLRNYAKDASVKYLLYMSYSFGI